ncbi:MAG: hypothetical protein WCS42_22065 [Verrucomicrobiota bacterium]
MKTLLIVVAAVVAVGVLAVAVRIGPVLYHRSVAEREYAVQGLQMVQGCNGGAAVQADGQVMMIKQYLEMLADSSTKDTNMVFELQSALVVAQEKARVLDSDCRKRGHCDSHPWRTNWIVVSQALTAFEKSDQ